MLFRILVVYLLIAIFAFTLSWSIKRQSIDSNVERSEQPIIAYEPIEHSSPSNPSELVTNKSFPKKRLATDVFFDFPKKDNQQKIGQDVENAVKEVAQVEQSTKNRSPTYSVQKPANPIASGKPYTPTVSETSYLANNSVSYNTTSASYTNFLMSYAENSWVGDEGGSIYPDFWGQQAGFGCDSEKPIFVSIGGYFGKSIYSNGSYGQLQFNLLPNGRCEGFYPVVQGSVSVLGKGHYSASLGGGLRHDVNCGDYTIGANVFGDARSSSCGSFTQFGGGLEVLSERNGWGLWINGYFPAGDSCQQCSSFLMTFPGGFTMQITPCQRLYKGFDAEFEKLLFYQRFCCSIARWYANVGTYGLWNRCLESTWGVKAKAKLCVDDYLSLEFRYTYDRVFRSCYQGVAMISLPLDFFSKCFGNECSPCLRPPQFIHRNDMPIIRNACRYTGNFF